MRRSCESGRTWGGEARAERRGRRRERREREVSGDVVRGEDATKAQRSFYTRRLSPRRADEARCFADRGARLTASAQRAGGGGAAGGGA
jgi:hypothetical protein